MARGTGTVVKARYSRGVRSAIALAKGHVRYAVHRANEAGRRQYRELWDHDGRISKQTAYARLDDARPADYVYRLTLSPAEPARQQTSAPATGELRRRARRPHRSRRPKACRAPREQDKQPSKGLRAQMRPRSSLGRREGCK